MFHHRLYYCYARLVVVLGLNLMGAGVHSQVTSCPPNIDFENGNFSNWVCSMGYVKEVVTNSAPQNVLDLSPSYPTILHHTLIPESDRDLDIHGRFPKHCPNGGKYSLLLGNMAAGAEAESISYTFTVPAGSNQFSLTYYYAVVLKNPNHPAHQQPRFRARVINVNTGVEINCVSFDFVASSGLPGFQTSAAGDVVYKDWSPVTINLGAYAGEQIKLEFITSDCIPGRDFGYAYVDVASNCGTPFSTASICEGDNFMTLNAREGFQGYQWYFDNNYSTLVSSKRVDWINTVPPTASSISMVATPFPGFGCVDTFVAPIKREPKPSFRAGPDRDIWCEELVQLGSAANPDYSFLWKPEDKLLNSAIANPRLKNLIFSPVKFSVVVTDNITACVTADSVVLTPINCFMFVPSAFTPNNDGLNDIFRPYLGGIKELKRFSVYNRSGNVVFSTTRGGHGWDGTYNGVMQQTGVFVWLVEYVTNDGKEAVEKGTVSLIR